VTERICRKCGQTKPLEDFPIRSGETRKHRCRECTKEYLKQYVAANKPRLLEGMKRYNRKHKKRLLALKRQDYNENKEKFIQKSRLWVVDNPEKRRAYLLRAKPRILAKSNLYRKRRIMTDISFKIACNLRSRLGGAIRSQKAGKKTSMKQYLGCSLGEFCDYLEKRFLPGMTWDNHGQGDGKWHIDHIRPCCSFDLTDPEQQKECFHYTNHRPLWQKDNLSKIAQDRKQSIFRHA